MKEQIDRCSVCGHEFDIGDYMTEHLISEGHHMRFFHMLAKEPRERQRDILEFLMKVME